MTHDEANPLAASLTVTTSPLNKPPHANVGTAKVPTPKGNRLPHPMEAENIGCRAEIHPIHPGTLGRGWGNTFLRRYACTQATATLQYVAHIWETM